jgi:hypothetical protein
MVSALLPVTGTGEKYKMNSSLTKSKKKRLNKAKRKVLKGSGDYEVSTMNMPVGIGRLDSKMDHLEKMLNKMNSKVSASRLGSDLGSLLPIPMGRELGGLAGSLMGKMFGKGDYEVKGNSLMKNLIANGSIVPKFSADGSRGIRLVERDFIGNITSSSVSGAFKNQSFAIDISNRTSFPFAGLVGYLFDEWEPHGIVYQFVSSSSEFNGASQALGSVIMSTDYNPSDPAYVSKQEMENADFACSTKPSQSLIHAVECDPNERLVKVFFTNDADVKLSTLGNFQIASVGVVGTNVLLGELWVTYDVTLYKKQLASPLDAAHFLTATGNAVNGQGMMSGVTLLSSGDGSIIISQTATTSILTLPIEAGATSKFFMVYFLTLLSAGDSLTMVGTNCTVTQRAAGGLAIAGMNEYIITVIAPGAFITTSTKAVAVSTWAMQITEVNGSFTIN